CPIPTRSPGWGRYMLSGVRRPCTCESDLSVLSVATRPSQQLRRAPPVLVTSAWRRCAIVLPVASKQSGLSPTLTPVSLPRHSARIDILPRLKTRAFSSPYCNRPRPTARGGWRFVCTVFYRDWRWGLGPSCCPLGLSVDLVSTPGEARGFSLVAPYGQ
ncbi:MAG: hypothetical protein J07HX5_00556, partial [halophilic archaeon J07HX5]